MTAEKNIILTSQQIQQKIKRIAYQILESNSNEKESCYCRNYMVMAFYLQKR